jgi:hypothetical protein
VGGRGGGGGAGGGGGRPHQGFRGVRALRSYQQLRLIVQLSENRLTVAFSWLGLATYCVVEHVLWVAKTPLISPGHIRTSKNLEAQVHQFISLGG